MGLGLSVRLGLGLLRFYKA